jgi:DNA-binding transcriptional regulator YdaS (Cro superfamily)
MSESNIEAAKVIELLGGNAKTAALCEVTPGAVSQWLRNGIPKAQLKFIKLARPELFETTQTGS